MASSLKTDLTERRQKVWDQAKQILARAERENRDLTGAETIEYDTLNDQLTGLRQRIDGLEDEERSNASAAEQLGRLLGTSRRSTSPQDREATEAIRSLALGRRTNVGDGFVLEDPEPRHQSNPGVEARALSKTSPANFSPVTFYSQIVESLVASSSVLSAGATVITTSTGEEFRVPRATALSTAAIVTEGSAISSSDPTLSAVVLGAYKYGVLITVSREALEDAGTDLQAYLARETGTALGLALGNHLINGTGTTQPRGVLLDASLGITGPVGTTTSFGTQATAGMGTDLMNSLYASVAEGYTTSPAAGFLARGATIAALRNLKASTGELVGLQYLNQAPAPFYPDAYVPTMAANAKSVLFGDWSRYFVRIVNGIRFERSDEYAFNTDQVTFRAILRADGALIDPSAIKWFANSAT